MWTVLHDIHDIPADGLNEQGKQDIQTILEGCREALKNLKIKLDKSEVVAYTGCDWKTKARQAWGKITWDQVEIDRLRDRITSVMTVFNQLMSRINQCGSFSPFDDLLSAFWLAGLVQHLTCLFEQESIPRHSERRAYA